MINLWPYIAIFFAGALAGYILKDQLTEEYVSHVTMIKPKVKGRGNNQELIQEAHVEMKKMSWKEKRAAKKKAREKDNS